MKTTFVVVAALATAALAPYAQAPSVQFDRSYPLKAEEGVFAYSRISPDGRVLAYASQMRDPTLGRMTTTQTVVDLPTMKVLFTEPGIDAYWSLDGTRMIFLSQGGSGGVTIRHHESGELVRNVAPVRLGDYFSWAKRDGKDLILTIQSNYYYLNGDTAVLPADRVVPCDDIGTGDRPLISKDGRRITTFVRGAVVVRGLTDCADIINTGLQGGKADFSWDGRYIAFHVPKSTPKAYEIVVVDLQRKTQRLITANLPGSSLFPSWTRDGRLSFRYDGDDYRGFMMATSVLSVPERPLPSPAAVVPRSPRWSDVFAAAQPPTKSWSLVLVWAPWNAHSPYALTELQQMSRDLERLDDSVTVMTAVEPSSRRADADRILRQEAIALTEVALDPRGFLLTEAANQMPTTLMFRDGRLIDRRLGAQSAENLRAWLSERQAR